jgi:hypothetical protein
MRGLLKSEVPWVSGRGVDRLAVRSGRSSRGNASARAIMARLDEVGCRLGMKAERKDGRMLSDEGSDRCGCC